MLRRYTDDDFAWLQQWVSSEELLFTFSGTDSSFPLTRKQLSDYSALNPHKCFYMACWPDGTPYGFGEIITNEPASPRIGRVLIGDPGNRGKGLGQTMVSEFVVEAIKLQPSTLVYLYVLDFNRAAISCYKRCGFVFSDSVSFTISFSGRDYKILKMQKQVNE